MSELIDKSHTYTDIESSENIQRSFSEVFVLSASDITKQQEISLFFTGNSPDYFVFPHNKNLELYREFVGLFSAYRLYITTSLLQPKVKQPTNDEFARELLSIANKYKTTNKKATAILNKMEEWRLKRKPFIDPNSELCIEDDKKVYKKELKKYEKSEKKLDMAHRIHEMENIDMKLYMNYAILSVFCMDFSSMLQKIIIDAISMETTITKENADTYIDTIQRKIRGLEKFTYNITNVAYECRSITKQLLLDRETYPHSIVDLHTYFFPEGTNENKILYQQDQFSNTVQKLHKSITNRWSGHKPKYYSSNSNTISKEDLKRHNEETFDIEAYKKELEQIISQ